MNQQGQFLSVFLQHEGDLRAFVGAVVRDSEVQDDIVQDTAMVAWRKFDQFDSTRSFGAWIRGIAANEIKKQARGFSRRAAVLSPESVEAVLEASNRREELTSSRREALQKCIDELPEKQRKLLRLRYEQVVTTADIAQKLGRTIAGVYKALSRIRIRLAECIERCLANE